MDWTDGYTTKANYTYGYHTELNPVRARLPLIHAGISPPRVRSACELGFGQGLSVNLHAAASITEWHGTDFNTTHATSAVDLAAAAGANAKLTDESFAEFATRSDLPGFDFIGIHGVWGWVSNENRAVLVDFVRRKLNLGGVLYIGYNTFPGNASLLPLRHLLKEHSRFLGTGSEGLTTQVAAALDFADQLLATKPAYLRLHPGIAHNLELIRNQDRTYVAHDYFNEHWDPVHFSTMATWLAPARVDYACSAEYMQVAESMHLAPEQMAFLQKIADRDFRETVRDLMLYRQFRRDYWVKGGRHLTPVEQAEAFRAERVVLMKPRSEVSLITRGLAGEAALHEPVYGPILDFLADYQVHTLGEIERAVFDKGLTLSNVVEVAMILCGKGDLGPAQPKAAAIKAKNQVDKLNAHLIAKARSDGRIGFLADATTGGGIPVDRIEQLFLHALHQGRMMSLEWADSTASILMAQNEGLSKDGRILKTHEQIRAELCELAEKFASTKLPVLRALQIV